MTLPPAAGWSDGDVLTDAERVGLIAELRREAAQGHVLFEVPVTVVGRCDGHCDDVAYALDDGRVALVHLSYPERAPDRPPWPVTELFADLTTFVEHLDNHRDETSD